jgi:hypothetical protein
VKKKSYFLDPRIKSYGCLKFQGEVWAGRACAGANQQELTTCAKSGGQGEKKFKKKGYSPTAVASTCGRRATAGRWPVLSGQPSGADHWSPGIWRPAVRTWSPGCDRAPTAGRRLMVGRPGPAGDQRSPAGRGLTPQPVELYLVF